MSMNLREQSSFICKLLNLVDCAIVCGFLWVLVHWYRVPWNYFYTYLLWLSFGLSLVSFQYFSSIDPGEDGNFTLNSLLLQRPGGQSLEYFFFTSLFSRFPMRIPG